jgi:hypothetical protein
MRRHRCLPAPSRRFRSKPPACSSACPQSAGFAVAGGAALIAHGLIQRPTRDVDLFLLEAGYSVPPDPGTGSADGAGIGVLQLWEMLGYLLAMSSARWSCFGWGSARWERNPSEDTAFVGLPGLALFDR